MAVRWSMPNAWFAMPQVWGYEARRPMDGGSKSCAARAGCRKQRTLLPKPRDYGRTIMGTWNWLSHVEQRLGHVTAAIATLERAMSMHPNEVHYHDRLGHLLQQQGEPARALMAAKKAASLHPTNEPLQQRVTDLERLTAAVSG